MLKAKRFVSAKEITLDQVQSLFTENRRNKMETKGKNRKLAEFMGYELKWSNITDNWITDNWYAPAQGGS